MPAPSDLLEPPEHSLAAILPAGETSLLEAVDRLLQQGVVAAGEATISVAGVDLIYLGLNLVLSSVETMRATAGTAGSGPPGPEPGGPRATGSGGGESAASMPSEPTSAAGGSTSSQLSGSAGGGTGAAGVEEPVASSPAEAPRPRLDLGPDNVEQGLAKLVLTLVEFLRQLLERQAVRRMEGGSLSDEEIERMGLALLRLQEKLWEMAAQFGLQPEDLNLNLGPLGNLL